MKAGPEMMRERERAFASALAASGMRRTHQRLEILRELAAADDHPDADTVFHRVRERIPTLSQDTVYRALAVLVDAGLIARIPMPRATRFDPDMTAHSHFICNRCGRLIDVEADAVSTLDVPVVIPGVGNVHSVNVELWGVCEQCGC